MGSFWKNIINKLENLSNELIQQQGDFLRNQLSDSGTSKKDSCFYLDEKQRGPWLKFSRFDAKKYFELNGNICLPHRSVLFSSLFYYDSVMWGIYPCSESTFESIHGFTANDLKTVGELTKNKRLNLYLTTFPRRYRCHKYLLPLFEMIEPLRLPWQPVILATQDEYDFEYDSFVDKISEIPSVLSAIKRFAKAGQEDWDMTETAFLKTVQDLHWEKFDELKTLVWKLITEDPDLAVSLVFAIRRVITNPMDIAPELAHSRSYEEFTKDTRLIGEKMKTKNIHFPGEIGALLETQLSYPSPINHDALKWCEDNLDIALIRQGFYHLQNELSKSLKSGDMPSIKYLTEKLESIWKENETKAKRWKSSIYWGTSLSVAAAGTMIAGPLVGLLASLGITSLSNVLLNPLSEYAAKGITGSSFHIWRLKKHLGRI